MTPTPVNHLRRIKSFVLRQGRMTEAQQQALSEHWQYYGLGRPLGEAPKDNKLYDFSTVFANDHPLILEIGFGMGDSLVSMAQNNPDNNYLGIEVHTPGIGRLCQLAHEAQLKNIRVFHADAVDVLNYNIPLGSLSAVYLFFPDPWQKKRHHKRRLVKYDFIESIYQHLKPGGLFHMATDWENYAQVMLKEMSTAVDQSHQNTEKIDLKFINLSASGDFIDRPVWRPQTKFEKKGLKKGHGIWDILYQKEKKNE